MPMRIWSSLVRNSSSATFATFSTPVSRCLPASISWSGATAAARPACWKPSLLGLGRSFRTNGDRAGHPPERAGLTCLPSAGWKASGAHPGLPGQRGETQLKIAGAQAQRLGRSGGAVAGAVDPPRWFQPADRWAPGSPAWLDRVFSIRSRPSSPSGGRVRRLLKQRNALLRQNTQYRQLAFWDQELVRLGGELAGFRASYCQAITPLIKEMTADFLPGSISVLDSIEAGKKTSPRCIAGGGVRTGSFAGVHWGRSAEGGRCGSRRTASRAGYFVRGQLKLLVCAMRLAQGLCRINIAAAAVFFN